MSVQKPATGEIPFDKTVMDRDTGVLIRKNIINAEYAYEFAHNLGRKPVRVEIIKKSQPCDYWIILDEINRMVLKFTEAKVDLTMRFE